MKYFGSGMAKRKADPQKASIPGPQRAVTFQPKSSRGVRDHAPSSSTCWRRLAAGWRLDCLRNGNLWEEPSMEERRKLIEASRKRVESYRDQGSIY
jgi:hypothetical protein